jgi:hypothetical protein
VPWRKQSTSLLVPQTAHSQPPIVVPKLANTVLADTPFAVAVCSYSLKLFWSVGGLNSDLLRTSTASSRSYGQTLDGKRAKPLIPADWKLHAPPSRVAVDAMTPPSSRF